MASFALEHLTFSYPGQTRPALDDLTLTIPEGAVTVLCGESEGKTSMAVSVGREALGRGIKAGALAKLASAITGGNGGGKPDFAMAGVRDATRVDEALSAVPELVRSLLK